MFLRIGISIATNYGTRFTKLIEAKYYSNYESED